MIRFILCLIGRIRFWIAERLNFPDKCWASLALWAMRWRMDIIFGLDSHKLLGGE